LVVPPPYVRTGHSTPLCLMHWLTDVRRTASLCRGALVVCCDQAADIWCGEGQQSRPSCRYRVHGADDSVAGIGWGRMKHEIHGNGTYLFISSTGRGQRHGGEWRVVPWGLGQPGVAKREGCKRCLRVPLLVLDWRISATEKGVDPGWSSPRSSQNSIQSC
jgi:hypothetical protein